MELRRRRLTSHVETGAMNDIMFFLMLFFQIASTMVNPNVIKIMLPNAKTGKAVSKKTFNLSVNANGEFFLDKKPIAPDNLENELITVATGVVEPTVVLRLDANLNVQKLVDILEVGNRLKIKMIMATQSPKG
jgi:biopolymer transport protein ExbD